MAHGHLRGSDQLDEAFATVVAGTMQALATPSRVRILGCLRDGALGVGELAEAVGMEPSAVSHQLRVLRHLGFVVGRRDGRRVLYDLHDDHVEHLLAEAIGHVEHLQLGLPGRGSERRTSAQDRDVEVTA
ncbi:MAG: ArsR/SmtB family transcription factor [Solirubrobacteraceae bacterium]